ncbi:thioesterase II family protein [Streptomyces sp. NPDC057381]|uniref:thioesterase II family protein n=1 Tax=unclassified Streptomyces TaxID=2593676 RepID=UPI0036356554
MSDAPPVPLHCFAHAGAGVSVFHGWSARLGAGALPVPHLLPGREGRRRERRATDREALLADLLDGFRSPAGPYLFYGHSLGALVAYTLARALHEAGLPTPELLAVGACPPPDAASVLSDACREPEQRLRELLDTLGTGPGDTVPGNLWQRKVLPVLRDDLALADALRGAARRPVAGGPFRVPVLAVAGADDPLAPTAVMAGWHRWTAGRVVTRTLPGDHFFVRGHPLPRLLGRACHVVRRLAARPALSTTGGRA